MQNAPLYVKIEGILPQLMHNGRLVNPLDPYAKWIRKNSSKRKKTDEDHIAMMEAEYKGSLYLLEDSTSKVVDGRYPYWPSDNIHAAIKTRAKSKKLGKVIDAALLVEQPGGVLHFNGPKTRSGLWDDPKFQMAKKTGRGTMCCRPFFEAGWTVEFNLNVVESAGITRDDLKDLIVETGKFVGLSDWPRRYGLFNVLEFDSEFHDLDFKKA